MVAILCDRLYGRNKQWDEAYGIIIAIKPFYQNRLIMKTKIVSVILAIIILLGESSCFIHIGGRKHGVGAGVGMGKPPVENQQHKSSAVPINHLKNAEVIASVLK